MGPLPRKGNMQQKITDYLDEIYGGTFTATHLQKLVTRIESAKRLITQRRKKHWDESDVVLITYADQFHSNDLKPLPTFNQFYPQWLQRIFSHVHLLPFYPWSSDDGFSVIDYHQVASEAGEWQDIQQLGECSHLMFDFVCNHMSAKSEWFKNYLQQQPGFEDFEAVRRSAHTENRSPAGCDYPNLWSRWPPHAPVAYPVPKGRQCKRQSRPQKRPPVVPANLSADGCRNKYDLSLSRR